MAPYSTSFRSSDPPPSERGAAPAPEPAAAERPVFAASGTARPRLLRVAGRVVAGLTLLWLAALALGVGGFGGLPGIDLPVVGKSGDASHDSSSRGAKPGPIAAARSDAARAAEMRSAHARRAARARRLAQPGAGSRPSHDNAAQTPNPTATATAPPGSATAASPHYSDSAVRRGTSSTAPGSRRSTTDTTTTTDSTASPRGNAVGRNTDPGVRRKSPR